jgi:HEAT repeat protein
MSGFLQLDLFGDRPDLDRSSNCAPAKPIAPEGLSDGDLISAIPDATLGEASAMVAEAGKRRLRAAVPALTSLCNRFVGYGSGVAVPEQIAALNALGAIDGPEAKHAVSRLIAKKIFQGPTLITALTVGLQLDVVLPSDVSLNLLRDPTSSVRAAACGCVRFGYEVITMLVSMIDDPDQEVALASACALGRMGRIEALGHLKRHLLKSPSRHIVEAMARVADEEAIVFLARTGRARRELTDIVITVLGEIESPRASDAADALKKLSRQAG